MAERLISSDDPRQSKIDFYLLQAGLNKFNTEETKTDEVDDHVLAIKMEILMAFTFDVNRLAGFFDIDENGSIDLHEFKTGCKRILPQNKYSDKEISDTYESIDKIGKGHINCPEFKAHFEGILRGSKKKDLQRLINAINDKDNNRILLEGCQQMDRQQNNYINNQISLTQFNTLLSNQGYNTDFFQLKSLMDYYKIPMQNETFNYQDFFTGMREDLLKTQEEQSQLKYHQSAYTLTLGEVCERIRVQLGYNSERLLAKFRNLDYDGSKIVKVSDAFECIAELGAC